MIALTPVDKMHTVAVLGTLPVTIPAAEFTLPEKGIDALTAQIEHCQTEIGTCEETLKKSSIYDASFQVQMLKAQNAENYSSASETAENDEDFVVSGTSRVIEPRTMQYRFAKILKNVNLPSVHFHALRHMFASNCIRLGFDIKALSEILGHSSVEITLNRYVHSSFEQKTEYMNRITICV